MARTEHGAPREVEVDGIAVRLTSPDKPVFPGLTKADVFDYYLAVGEPMIRQVGDRPTALERWPEGVSEGAEHFFQKHLPRHIPDYVDGVDVRFPSGRVGRLLRPTTRASILWAVQMGAITFHAWPVIAADVEHPDQLRIDLDPSPDSTFADIVAMALACRALLDELGLPAFVKTSGSAGLHVFVPIVPEHSFVDVRHAAIGIGRELARRHPDALTMSWWKEERGSRVFLDFNQNAQDRLIASAYSVRPREVAPVSLPITWDELDGLDPMQFTVRTVPGIVASRAGDPWAAMTNPAALAPALALWEADLTAGLPDLPYPPDFPKMPGEPKRVQPSRDTDRPR